jgi:hypothetical protein
MYMPRIHWGAGVALVYAAFACGTLGFVGFAIAHPAELVGADYYARSLAHDDRMAATTRADGLGDLFTCVPSGDGRALIVTARGRASAAPVTGSLTLYRPSDVRADRTLPFAPDARGVQRVSIEGLAHGRWVLQLQWQAQGLTYYHEQHVVVP